MRLFAGIQTPLSWAVALTEGQGILRERYGEAIRWVSPELFHITLRFLGELPLALANQLAADWSREDVRLPALPMRVSSWGCFPQDGAGRVLWAGVEVDKAAWGGLCSYVDALLKRFDIRCDKGNSIPHITVGRVKNPQNLKGVREMLEGMMIGTEVHEVDRVSLFESRQTLGSSSYRMCASFKLV
jgi:2'-5' RNA ligase